MRTVPRWRSSVAQCATRICERFGAGISVSSTSPRSNWPIVRRTPKKRARAHTT
jgi:hypothetical protein